MYKMRFPMTNLNKMYYSPQHKYPHNHFDMKHYNRHNHHYHLYYMT
ncbi:MAG: hypothetical protein K2O61_02420 [Bacteroidaceae bacterium]|nr:hypothetical protein [Bacteroidaceae bacterium]